MEQTQSTPAADPKPWLFKPGQSGNPKGRPKRRVHVRELVRANAKEWHAALLALAQDAKADGASRLEACKLAMAYLSGPPPSQPVEVPDDEAEDMTAEQAAALLERAA